MAQILLKQIEYKLQYIKYSQLKQKLRYIIISMKEHKSQRSNSESAEVQDKNVNSQGMQATDDMLFQNYINLNKSKQINKCQKSINKMLHNIFFQIFITVVALYSLFSDDIRIASTNNSADLGFDIVHIILIFIFSIEIVLNWISSEDYRLSFFFFLDVISSLSLILDISMITQLMYQNNTSTYNVSRLAAQSRASRVATRAVRIVKLVRIIRIVKLYKAATSANELKQQIKKKKLQQNRKKNLNRQEISQKKSHKQEEKRNKATIQFKDIKQTQNATKQLPSQNNTQKNQQEQRYFDADFISEITKRQSKVSKVLSDITIKKIIIVVLLLMIIVPLFDNSNYTDKAESWDSLTTQIHQLLYKKNQISTQTIKKFINDMINEHQGDSFLVYFSTPFNELPYYQHDSYNLLRVQQITTSSQQINVSNILSVRPDLTLRTSYTDKQNTFIYASMSYRNLVQTSAYFSIGNTIFICIVLIIMLNFFTEDINELIVVPIQKMMRQVIQMAKNPQSVTMSLIDNTQYQTAIVHNAIVKIGALLSLVFGSAGAEIIGSNIMNQGDMNPMIGGRKKCAIFGFCDIKKFTQVTQLLQEDIMIFVNKIGQLVHSSVYRYGGSANKNIGEAFLMIWPLPQQTYKINNKTNQITWKNQRYVNVMSDFSVLSFVKALVKINKDPSVLQYRKDPRLLNGLGLDYKVKMGFGLHIGWAIQGAIGSQYKIDASYLSPNVNMASRLQAATKQFGVNILISEDLYEMITPSMKKFCRNIDRVTVKGSAKPIRLYTIDLRLQNISPPADKTKKYKNPQDCYDIEIKKEINMQYLEPQKIYEYDAETFIRKKKQLRQVMVDAINPQFKKRFQLGLNNYISGKWSDARMHLNQALKYSKNDGPTNNLLNYMRRFQFVVPEDWKNYRSLTEK